MDRALDSDEPPADGSHIGGELPYILAGLGAACLVSMGLMAINSLTSFLNQRRQHMEAHRDIERLHVVQGDIVTLETLDSTSPAENYKFSQYSELRPSLQSHALETLELCAICLEVFQNSETVRRLTCKHLYHQQCIDRWFQGRHLTCPLCKSIYVKRQGSATAS
ncbi:hypothetical protein HYE67_002974 [Fusarium culmorum]|uniref:RING-type domain-containing protein n=1 Tax=Fusarium culmorum TaxID=5516 RepID=A0A7S8HTJ1_FUSCU|nr:hypothetical protein HYE67_002974 [Fusarium culmorum]